MAAEIRIVVSQTGSGSAIAQAKRDVEGLGDAAGRSSGGFSTFGQIATGALREIGSLAVHALGQAARAMGDFVVTSVTSAGDFEQGLSVLKAVTGATSSEIARMRDLAIQLGNDITLPATSAQSAAQAMQELAKAGLSVNDTMAAAKGTLQLATAAQVDAARAASIVAGALNAFGLEGKEATRIADLLAAAANASSASMTDLAQGLQQGGFMFDATGQSVDDLVTSLAILTNVGLTGSDAGTALKNAMTRLINPTEKAKGVMGDLGLMTFDTQKAMKTLREEGIKPVSTNTQDLANQLMGVAGAMGMTMSQASKWISKNFELSAVYDVNTGKMKSWSEVIGILDAATEGLTDAQRNEALSTIFLSDGMKALLPLLDTGQAGFEAMKQKVTAAGAANALAGAQTEGFNGALAAMRNALETLQLVIGTALLPVLSNLLNNYITPGIGSVMNFAQAMFASTDPIAFLGAKINELIPGLSSFMAMIQPLTDLIGANLEPILVSTAAVLGVVLVAAIASAVAAMLTVAAPILAAIAAGAALYAAWQTDFMGIQTAVMTVMTAIQSVIQSVVAFVVSFWQTNGAQISADTQTIWNQIYTAISTAITLIQTVLSYTLNGIAEFIKAHGSTISGYFHGVWTVISGIIQAALSLITGILQTALALWRGDFSGAWDAIKTMSAGFVSALLQVLRGGLELVKNAFALAIAAVKTLFNGLIGDAKGIGSSIIDGIVAGVKSAAGRLASAAVQVAKDALAAVKSVIQTGSPSRVFAMEVGAPMAQGMAVGLLNNAPMVARAAQMTAGAAVEGGRSAVTTNTRTINFNPTYNNVANAPTLDYALATSLAGV